jgi:hypothetical protein
MQSESRKKSAFKSQKHGDGRALPFSGHPNAAVCVMPMGDTAEIDCPHWLEGHGIEPERHLNVGCGEEFHRLTGREAPTRSATAYSPRIVAELRAAGVLTDSQAAWLVERWQELPPEWSSVDPLMRSVGEHSQAYIDHCRRLEIAGDEAQ